MKKFINILGLFIILGITFSACSEDPLYTEPTPTPIKVTSIAVQGLTANILTLEKSKTHQIKIAFTPTNATDISKYAFTYKSADTKIATVSSTGVVTAVATGDVMITVTPTNNTKLEKTFKVVVPESFVSVESVEIAATAPAKVVVGATIPLITDVTVKPANASNKAVTYTSSDVTKATVSNTGVVTGVAAGEVTITIASVEKPAIKTTHKVTIELPAVTSVTVAGPGVIGGKLELEVAKTATLVPTVLPAGADQSVTYISSTPATATVDAAGKITAVAAGTTTITVASKADATKKAEITVTVKAAAPAATSVTVTGVTDNKVTLEETKTVALTATVQPATANQTVTYATSDATIATVSATGVITAVKAGTATISVLSSTAGIKQDIVVTVTAPVVVGAPVWADRTGWTVTPTHTHIVPKDIDTNDIGILGTPESLIDNDERSCMTLVKPGKTFVGANATVTVDGEDKIGFTLNLQTPTEFSHIFMLPRDKGGIAGLLLKTIKLEGSANGTTWVDMEEAVIPLLATTPRGTEAVKLSKTYTYQYVRVTYIDYQATGGSTAQVAEFKLGLAK